jgi:glycosyltransferase involved in cell wall biosynthesis
MAVGKAIICLDLGGPALMVTHETGFKIAAQRPELAVTEMADAMRRLARSRTLREQFGSAANRRASDTFSWTVRGEQLNDLYAQLTQRRSVAAPDSQRNASAIGVSAVE